MKKLIKELEKLSRVSPSLTEWGEGYIPGVMDALQIVKSHNPWHDVTELPPYHEGQFKDSIEVNVMDFKSKIKSAGYYSYERKCWQTDYRPMNVTHWTYLPELPQ